MTKNHYPNFPPPDSEDSTFSDPEIPYPPPVINWNLHSTGPRQTSFTSETDWNSPTIPRAAYPPPPVHSRSHPNSMSVRPPRRIITKEFLEERRMINEGAKKAERVSWKRRVLGVLAVLVAVLSWIAFAGWTWDVKDHLCRIPGMGPCLRFEERVEDTLKWWGESVTETVVKEPKRVGRKRGMLFEGDDNFETIVCRMAGSLMDVENVVQGLRDGREEMANALVRMAGHRVDIFEVLVAHFKDSVEKGVDAIYRHKGSVEKVLDQSINIMTDGIRGFEGLQKNGPRMLHTWLDQNFGNYNELSVMQQKIKVEVRELAGFLELWIMSGIGGVKRELSVVVALRRAYEEIALILTKGKPDEDRFEDAGYWKDVLINYYVRAPPNIEGVSAGLADTWVAVEDAKFLVADNLERLHGLIKALDELKAGPNTDYAEDEDAIGDYIDLVKNIRENVEQAKAESK